jgi:hypothetical protein
VLQREQIILGYDVSIAQIQAMKIGDSYVIPDKTVKKQLNSILSQMGLTSHYDSARHISTWKGRIMCYRVDHGKKTIVCESDGVFK